MGGKNTSRCFRIPTFVKGRSASELSGSERTALSAFPEFLHGVTSAESNI